MARDAFRGAGTFRERRIGETRRRDVAGIKAARHTREGRREAPWVQTPERATGRTRMCHGLEVYHPSSSSSTSSSTSLSSYTRLFIHESSVYLVPFRVCLCPFFSRLFLPQQLLSFGACLDWGPLEEKKRGCFSGGNRETSVLFKLITADVCRFNQKNPFMAISQDTTFMLCVSTFVQGSFFFFLSKVVPTAWSANKKNEKSRIRMAWNRTGDPRPSNFQRRDAIQVYPQAINYRVKFVAGTSTGRRNIL